MIFISRNGQQEGPFDEDQIRQKLLRGDFTLNDLAWHEGLSEWQPIQEVLGIRLPPPPPPTSLPIITAAPPAPVGEVSAPPLLTHPSAEFMLRTYGTFKKKQGGPYSEAEVRQLLKDKTYRAVDRALIVGSKDGKWQPIHKALGEKLPATDAVKGCLGCLGILLFLFIGVAVIANIEQNESRKEFTEHRTQILKDVGLAADVGAHARVIELAEKYGFIHDPELDKHLDESRAALKAAEERKQIAKAEADAAAEARRRPDPRRSQTYQNSWWVGYADGERAHDAGLHPIGQQIQMDAFTVARGFPPADQMEFVSGYTTGYGAGYNQ